MLNNHCSINRGSANKLTNLQEQSKPSNNQINSIQSAPLNNHDNISSDNSEIQSMNNTLNAATMDEKQKMLLLKIANNSIAAASAVASAADNDYGNVSSSLFMSFHSFCPVGLFSGCSCYTLGFFLNTSRNEFNFLICFYNSIHTPTTTRTRQALVCWVRRHRHGDVARPLCLTSLLFYIRRTQFPSRQMTKMLCQSKKWRRQARAYGKWVEYLQQILGFVFKRFSWVLLLRDSLWEIISTWEKTRLGIELLKAFMNNS